MTPRTWAYGDVESDDDPVRDRPYESFGQQGFGLPTYSDGPDRGAEPVELGEPVAPSNATASSGWQRRDDRIHDEVRAHLETAARLDATELDVIVHHGEVVLSGTVRDADERDSALRVVRATNGVVDVVSRIRVAEGAADDRDPVR